MNIGNSASWAPCPIPLDNVAAEPGCSSVPPSMEVGSEKEVEGPISEQSFAMQWEALASLSCFGERRRLLRWLTSLGWWLHIQPEGSCWMPFEGVDLCELACASPEELWRLISPELRRAHVEIERSSLRSPQQASRTGLFAEMWELLGMPSATIQCQYSSFPVWDSWEAVLSTWLTVDPPEPFLSVDTVWFAWRCLDLELHPKQVSPEQLYKLLKPLGGRWCPELEEPLVGLLHSLLHHLGEASAQHQLPGLAHWLGHYLQGRPLFWRLEEDKSLSWSLEDKGLSLALEEVSPPKPWKTPPPLPQCVRETLYEEWFALHQEWLILSLRHKMLSARYPESFPPFPQCLRESVSCLHDPLCQQWLWSRALFGARWEQQTVQVIDRLSSEEVWELLATLARALPQASGEESSWLAALLSALREQIRGRLEPLTQCLHAWGSSARKGVWEKILHICSLLPSDGEIGESAMQRAHLVAVTSVLPKLEELMARWQGWSPEAHYEQLISLLSPYLYRVADLRGDSLEEKTVLFQQTRWCTVLQEAAEKDAFLQRVACLLAQCRAALPVSARELSVRLEQAEEVLEAAAQNRFSRGALTGLENLHGALDNLPWTRPGGMTDWSYQQLLGWQQQIASCRALLGKSLKGGCSSTKIQALLYPLAERGAEWATFLMLGLFCQMGHPSYWIGPPDEMGGAEPSWIHPHVAQRFGALSPVGRQRCLWRLLSRGSTCYVASEQDLAWEREWLEALLDVAPEGGAFDAPSRELFRCLQERRERLVEAPEGVSRRDDMRWGRVAGEELRWQLALCQRQSLHPLIAPIRRAYQALLHEVEMGSLFEEGLEESLPRERPLDG